MKVTTQIQLLLSQAKATGDPTKELDMAARKPPMATIATPVDLMTTMPHIPMAKVNTRNNVVIQTLPRIANPNHNPKIVMMLMN